MHGPRVRVGVLWFLLVLAAATSGRWWTAALWSLMAFLAGLQTVLAWERHRRRATRPGPSPATLVSGVLAGLFAVAVVAAGSYGTGLAGVVLTALAATAGVGLLLGGPARRVIAPVVIGILLPAIAATSVVLAVRTELWAGLFLLLAVSLYDAGAFVFGAESKGRWEGPVSGVIGVLAVTFTLTVTRLTPFEPEIAWIVGAAVAVSCVLGQAVVSACLPRREARAGALRRLDAYVVAGPVFIACLWLTGV